MAHTPTPLVNLLGMNKQGDLGGFTGYTSVRGKFVVFVKSPPLCGPTPPQQSMRNFFRLVASTWRLMTPEQRQSWNQLADRSKLRIGGYSLYTWFQRSKDYQFIQALETKTGVQVYYARPTT